MPFEKNKDLYGQNPRHSGRRDMSRKNKRSRKSTKENYIESPTAPAAPDAHESPASFDTGEISFGPLNLPFSGPVGEEILHPDFEIIEFEDSVEEISPAAPDENEPPVPRHVSDKKKQPADDNKKKRNKIIAITASVLLALVVMSSTLWQLVLKDMWIARTAEPVGVMSVGLLTGLEETTVPKYAGLIEPQETVEVKKDASKILDTVLVEVGDSVTQGEVLFTYNTDQMNIDLRQIALDIENSQSKIAELQNQIKDLEQKLSKANDESDKASYTLQINDANLSVKNEEYQITVKRLDEQSIQENIDNAQVLSEYTGTVKEVNLSDQTDNYGNPKPFISIQMSGDYRAMGSISELNVGFIHEGQRVIIRSRLDKELTWGGMVEKIDYENALDSSNNNNGFFFDNSLDGNNQATKYPFYIALDSFEGLILGQHIYIEPIPEMSSVQEGLWLPAFYILHDRDEPYVWARGEKDTLVQRSVILGPYESESDMYQIISGITIADYIAFPGEEYQVGAPTVITEDIFQEAPQQSLPDGIPLPGDDPFGDGGYPGDIPEDDDYSSNDPYADPEYQPYLPEEDNNSDEDSGGYPPQSSEDDRQYFDGDGNIVELSVEMKAALPEVS